MLIDKHLKSYQYLKWTFFDFPLFAKYGFQLNGTDRGFERNKYDIRTYII